MKELLVIGYGLSKMCRLCLKSDVKLGDIFWFSSKLKGNAADAIMECAPIQIKKSDQLPNYICKSCYIHLVSAYRFQALAVQSDKTLHRYLQELHNITVDKKPEPIRFDNNYCNVESAVSFDAGENFFPLISDHEDSNSSQEIEMNPIGDVFKCQETEMYYSKNTTIFEKTKVDLTNTITCDDTKIGFPVDKKAESARFNNNCKVENDISFDDSNNYYSPIDKNSFHLMSSIDYRGNQEIEIGQIDKFIKYEETETSYSEGTFICEETKVDFTTSEETKLGLANTGVDDSDSNSQMTRNLGYIKGLPNLNISDWNIKYEHFENESHIKQSNESLDKPFASKLCKSSDNNSKNDHILSVNTKQYKNKSSYDYDKRNKKIPYSGYILIHKREKPYQCDICKKCFRQLSQLNSHKLIHTGEKPYQCDICKKCFRQLSNLNNHKLIHTGEKPYQCDICKKCFRQLSNLNNHILLHTGEKPFQCDICKMCFRQVSNLNNHKAIHTGEKPYQCDICKMSFKQIRNLNNHKSIHTGEKPYQCDICKMCFKHNRTLNNHKSIHTGEKPYQCDICKMCFRQMDYLKRHKLIHKREAV